MAAGLLSLSLFRRTLLPCRSRLRQALGGFHFTPPFSMVLSELRAIYDTPFFELISRSRAVFLQHWSGNEVQLCTLLSIKTGGCSEDCGYCAQSARYSTGVQAERLLSTEAVLATARSARANGSTRFCMGAAWKGVRDGEAKFEQVLETIRE